MRKSLAAAMNLSRTPVLRAGSLDGSFVWYETPQGKPFWRDYEESCS